MKLKKEFVAHSIGDTQVMSAAEGSAFSGVLRSNETAAFIVERLRRENTPESIIADLYAESDAPIGVVAADVELVLNLLRRIDALDE